MNATTISLSRPEEALLLIPHVVGYRPANHFVMLGLQGAAGAPATLGPAYSFDLAETPLGHDLAASVRQILEDFDMQVCVFALYVETLGGFVDSQAPAKLADLLEIVARSMAGRTDAYFAAFVADETTWVRVDAPVFRPRPFAALAKQAAHLERVFGRPAPRQAPPGPDLPRLAHDFAALARKEGTAWAARGEADLAREGALAWDEMLAKAAALEGHSTLADDAGLVGRANASLSIAAIRDRLMLFSSSAVENLPLAGVDEADIDRAVAAMGESRPDPAKVGRTITALDVCAAAAEPADPHAQAVAAYLAWWNAWPRLARHRALGALERDRSNTLAQMILELVTGRKMPPWMDASLARARAEAA